MFNCHYSNLVGFIKDAIKNFYTNTDESNGNTTLLTNKPQSIPRIGDKITRHAEGNFSTVNCQIFNFFLLFLAMSISGTRERWNVSIEPFRLVSYSTFLVLIK